MARHSAAGRSLRPQGAVAVNRASPQAKGLEIWLPLTSAAPHDPHTGNTWARSGGPSIRPATLHGVALSLDGTDDYVSGDTNQRGLAPPFSVMAWIRPNFSDTTSARHMVMTRGTTGSYTRFGFNIQYLGDLNQWRCDATPGGAAHMSDTVAPFSAGEIHHVGFAVNASGTAQGYWDGVSKTTTTDTSISAPNPTAGDPWFVGTLSAVAGDGRYFNGEIWDVRVYSRYLQASDWAAIVSPRSRFDLYATPSRRVYDLGGGAPAGNRRRRVLLAS